jgi:hypothetical protein
MRQFIAILILFFAFSAKSEVFRNAYISFELPNRWKCVLEETEWVCRSAFPQQTREAIIVLTAKEMGPKDTLGEYMNFLRIPRVIVSRTGARLQSKVIQVQQVNIAQHPWIDGQHLGSEIPSYYTRYLATVKDRLAILVTFSAHQTQYTKYTGDFIKAIQSLKVVADRQLLSPTQTVLGSRPGNGPFGSGDGDLPGSVDEGEFDNPKTTGGGTSPALLLVAVLCIVGGAYFWLKKNKKL